MDLFKKKAPAESEVRKRNQRLLNALILLGVFLLGALLPMKYKAFAPLLFLIPVLLDIVNKINKSSEIPGVSSGNRTYPPSMPRQMNSHEPYTYKPKDPKDPRKYKPIG